MSIAESFNDLRAPKIASLVAKQVRDAIIRGELATGDNLPAEAKLVALYGVSRATIREAIRILESENLITVARGPRGGAKIKQPSLKFVTKTLGLTLQARNTTLDDVYMASSIIEPPIARLASETRPKQAGQILRSHLETEYRLVNDLRDKASVLTEFHRLLVQQSGNQTLTILVEVLYSINEKHLSRLHNIPKTPAQRDALLRLEKKVYRSHEKLIDFIEAGDGDGAEKHWTAHLKRAREYWLRGFGSDGLELLD